MINLYLQVSLEQIYGKQLAVNLRWCHTVRRLKYKHKTYSFVNNINNNNNYNYKKLSYHLETVRQQCISSQLRYFLLP